MKFPRQSEFYRWLTNGMLGGAILVALSGCGRGAGEPAVEAKAPLAIPQTGIPAAATATNGPEPAANSAPTGVDELLKRIAQLEEVEAKRGQSVEELQKSHDQEIQQLHKVIASLENKVAAIESARVLPEMVVGGEESPTTQELEQKIRVLERKNELAGEAAEARVKESPRLEVGPAGFAFSSADSNFVARLRGVLQADSRTFFSDNSLSKGNDSFLIRRARPILEGTVFNDFDFQFVPDFGGSSVQIFDASLNYRLRPELQFRAGKFKGPVGLEQLQSDVNLAFNERSLATDLVPIRNVGFEVWGDIADGTLSYAAGVFNGSGDGRNSGTSDFGDDKEFAARLFARPFQKTQLAVLRGLGFGVGGSYSDISSNTAALPANTGGSLSGYATEGQQQFFAYDPSVGTVAADGAHWRLSPQFLYYWGPFGLMGEYVLSDQGVANNVSQRRADLQNSAWEVSAQWVLTGEQASFNGIIPKRPFNWRGGGLGAWQLVGRYSHLSIDDGAFQGFANPATSASSATAWSAGINWWLNRNLRVMTSFTHTSFQGGGQVNPIDPGTVVPPATVTHQDENILFTRLQLAF